MNDELKHAWQSQAPPQRLTLDAALVLNEVRRNEQKLAASILRRDMGEVGVALLLVPIWIYLGIQRDTLWSWYLVVPTLLWIAGFMTVDRLQQRRRQPRAGDTLRSGLEASLAQVDHQIWLLRNIFWWYLLPPGVALIIFPAHRAWVSGGDRLEGFSRFLFEFLVFVLVGWFIYWLNQRCVRKNLEPRRQELQALLGSLNEAGEPPQQ